MAIYSVALEITGDENNNFLNKFIEKFSFSEFCISYKRILNGLFFIECKHSSDVLMTDIISNFNEFTISEKLTSNCKLKICVSELCSNAFVAHNTEYIGDWLCSIVQRNFIKKLF